MTRICSYSSKSPPNTSNISFHCSVRYLKFLLIKTEEEETKFYTKTSSRCSVFALSFHWFLLAIFNVFTISIHESQIFIRLKSISTIEISFSTWRNSCTSSKRLMLLFFLLQLLQPSSSFSTCVSTLISRLSYSALCMCIQTHNDIAMLLEQFLIPPDP